MKRIPTRNHGGNINEYLGSTYTYDTCPNGLGRLCNNSGQIELPRFPRTPLRVDNTGGVLDGEVQQQGKSRTATGAPQLYKWQEQLRKKSEGTAFRGPGRPPKSEQSEIERLRAELKKGGTRAYSFKRTLHLVIAIVVALVATSCQAGANDLMDPTTLLHSIKRKGADIVWNKELTHEQKVKLLKNVETGQESWLKVAAAIFPGTDGGDATSIVLAASSALTRSPRAVLLIVAPELGIRGICDYSELTMSYRGITQRKVLANDIDARINAVRKLSGADVATPRDQCLKALEESKREMLGSEDLFPEK